MLTHLLNAEEDHCDVIAIMVAGEMDRLPTEFELNAHNERRVIERGHLTREELLSALAVRRAQTVTFIESLTPEQLTTAGPHPVFGDVSTEYVFRVIAMHDMLHVRDIKAVLEGVE